MISIIHPSFLSPLSSPSLFLYNLPNSLPSPPPPPSPSGTPSLWPPPAPPHPPLGFATLFPLASSPPRTAEPPMAPSLLPFLILQLLLKKNVLLFCPSAEFTKSLNKLGFFSMIAMPEDRADEDQLLLMMLPTMEVGWLSAAGGGSWWVQDGFFGCQAGLAWAED
ncbi:hypothetical protein TIFTF001_026333 [Ficus carica]|uniref:Uncharacterized protein n=1 Tax=Ficus carica TaxID=3494 RepID=A0AA88DKZ2_FICCA|nr:hypothetical protein TIFTF001_026333 [Ficus carica]